MGVVSLLDKRILKVAVVGSGKMGLLHASIINIMQNSNLVAICDKSVLVRKFLKKGLKGIRIVDDVKKFSDFDLDAVYVTTPIPSHFSVVKAIYSGKICQNIFVEKTLSACYAEAKELYDLSKSFPGINMVGYVRRFSVTFRKAKDLLDKGAIGKPTSFEAYAFSSDLLGIDETSKAPLNRGGVLKDLGSHAVDVALWFFGDLNVSTDETPLSDGVVLSDFLRFGVENQNGLEGKFEISWRVKNYRTPEIGFSIIGTKGKLRVNDDKIELKLKGKSSLTMHRHDLHDNAQFWLGGPEYFREDEHFVKSVLQNVGTESDFLNALKVDEILDILSQRDDENV